MPDLEAIGDAATGAVIARAVEPGTGEAGVGGDTHETRCLNCGAGLVGPYCRECGQRANVHRTLGAFWHDLVHSVLHLDGKLGLTLPLLAWRPGELTRRYVDGERAKFVSPMALFLFSVFLMFAVFTVVGGPVVTGSPQQSTAAERAEAEAEFQQERAEAVAELRALEAKRAELVRSGQETRDVDIDIRVKRSEIALGERLFRQTMNLIAADEKRDADQARRDATVESNANANASAKGEGVVVIRGADRLNAWANDAYQKAKKNPSLLIYKIQTNAYKFSWLLIPISVPFLWLLFLHRRRYRQFTAYDHTVFVTYSIAFMTLGAVALSLARPLGLPAAAAVLLMILVPPLHIYRQLKGAYGLSRYSALWRTAAVLMLSLVALGLFALVLLFLGVLG